MLGSPPIKSEQRFVCQSPRSLHICFGEQDVRKGKNAAHLCGCHGWGSTWEFWVLGAALWAGFFFAGPRAVRASEQRGSLALGLIICERFCTLKAEPSPFPLEDGKTLSVINSGMLFSLVFVFIVMKVLEFSIPFSIQSGFCKQVPYTYAFSLVS